MAAFADSADMIAQYDERELLDLCSDTGEPATTLAGNGKLSWALNRATGAIKSAILVGRLYTVDDLAALDSESDAFLKGLCCELALCYLVERRPEKYGDWSKDLRERMEKTLDRFRKGERIFPLDDNLDASLPTIDGPTAVVYDRLNLLPDRTKHFYPPRSRRLPIGRG